MFPMNSMRTPTKVHYDPRVYPDFLPVPDRCCAVCGYKWNNGDRYSEYNENSFCFILRSCCCIPLMITGCLCFMASEPNRDNFGAHTLHTCG